jgi:hypothetical protein
VVLAAVLAGGLAAVPAPAGAAGAAQYPDLVTLPPRDLRVARVDVSVDGTGDFHNVLQFTNTPWNRGEGRFELRARIDPSTGSGPAVQRIFDADGGYVDEPVGSVTHHGVHNHYHFDGWGRYELWSKAAYDAWVAGGRTTGSPQWTSPKTTSCVLDEEPVDAVPGTPAVPRYDWRGCNLAADNTLTMGLSPGWGDTYDYFRFEQWIDLGQSTLADGAYVLRSVTDDGNVLWESQNRADPAREANNDVTTAFTVNRGSLQDGAAPSGTVWINGVDTETSNPTVNLKVLGRDDVSGVDAVRISNDGATWSQRAYSGVNSTPQEISWDITDARYGGTPASGPHTVSVQFRDRTGTWSSSITDTIALVTCAPGSSTSNYAQAIAADGPVSSWRLGESCGTAAADERGLNPGTYLNGPALGRPSLLEGDPANTSVGLSGAGPHVAVPHHASLSLGAAFSLEAWIRPDAIPAAGGWASVVTKAESYSLQFNGPRLEFTIIQNGARRRLPAPAGAVAVGVTAHVVGTYDGATQRLYVNGTEVAAVGLAGGATATTAPLRIGSWDGAGEFFSGTVDEVAVYAKALTPAQVANHQSAGRTSQVTRPAPPSDLTAVASGGTVIDVSWRDNASNETGFVLERSATPDFAAPTTRSFAPDVTTFRDSGLTPATTYHYRVKATNGSGDSDWSAAASATTPAAPAPPSTPTGLSATATGASSIDLRWTDTSNDETAFVLERDTSSAFTSAVTRTIPPDTTATSETGLQASTTYYFRVRAQSGAGTSAASNTASATTSAPPAAASYADTVAADGAVSHWRLGETAGATAADRRGSNHDTYAGGVALGRPGLLAADPDAAIALDGVDGQVIVPAAPSLDLTTTFTIEAWIRPAALPKAGGWASVVTKQESYSLQFNGPKLEFTVIQARNRQRLQAPSGAVAVGATVHVVATYDGSTQRLYLDGVLVASRSFRGAATVTANPLRLGSWDGRGEFFNGSVDEVAVYGRALSAAQVANHASRGRAAG